MKEVSEVRKAHDLKVREARKSWKMSAKKAKCEEGEIRMTGIDHRLLKLMFEQCAALEAPPKPRRGWKKEFPVNDGRCNRCLAVKSTVLCYEHFLCSSCIGCIRRGDEQ